MATFQIEVTYTQKRQIVVEADNSSQAVQYVVTDQLEGFEWKDIENTQNITDVKGLSFENINPSEYQNVIDEAF